MVQRFVDLELDDEDQHDAAVPELPKPEYPWGLRICLTEKELAKLGLDADCEVGDMLRMDCMAVVTSVSSNQNADKTCHRVELQIQQIACGDE